MSEEVAVSCSPGGLAVASPVTVISLPPSLVWLRRRAVRAAVWRSNLMTLDLVGGWVSGSVVMSMEEIVPLRVG